MNKSLKWIIPPAVSSFLITIFIFIFLGVKNNNYLFQDLIINFIKMFPTFFGIFYIFSIFILFFMSKILIKMEERFLLNKQEINFWTGLFSLLFGFIGGFLNYFIEKDFLKSFLIFVCIVFGINFLISIFVEMRKNEKNNIAKH